MKFMENAVRFEREPNKLRVKLRLSVDGGTHGVELHTIMEAMDVSLYNSLCFFCLVEVGVLLSVWFIVMYEGKV